MWQQYGIVQNCAEGKFWQILTFQIFDGKILTDGHCLSPYTYKHCIIFKQFDDLNFHGLAGKCQKRKNSSHQTLCYTVYISCYTFLLSMLRFGKMEVHINFSLNGTIKELIPTI